MNFFKLGGFAAAAADDEDKIFELVQSKIDVYIPFCKYHLKPHSFP